MNCINFNQFIEFHQGNIPLILSIPHGGDLKNTEIPDRVNGILGTDSKTIELGKELITMIEKYKQGSNKLIITPSYVISLIHRSKIDLNREEFEAFNPKSDIAKLIYDFYHQKLKEIILYNLKTFNSSFLIDIHGFESDKRPEGYRDVDLILGSNNLGTLYTSPIPKKDWGKSMRGKIVKAFNKDGILIAPGHHLRKEYVLTGGYITTKYGASSISRSQSMQIEFSDRVRIFDNFLRKIVLSRLVQILYDDYLFKYI
ncbi:MAG: hypothetical protein ACFFKA_12340 [Candidatus Thorarchaeota archaeon]